MSHSYLTFFEWLGMEFKHDKLQFNSLTFAKFFVRSKRKNSGGSSGARVNWTKLDQTWHLKRNGVQFCDSKKEAPSKQALPLFFFKCPR